MRGSIKMTRLGRTKIEAGDSELSVGVEHAGQVGLQIPEHGHEQTLDEMFRLLNDNLAGVVAAGEKDPVNLLYMFDIIFALIAYRPGMPSLLS